MPSTFLQGEYHLLLAVLSLVAASLAVSCSLVEMQGRTLHLESIADPVYAGLEGDLIMTIAAQLCLKKPPSFLIIEGEQRITDILQQIDAV